VQQRRAKRLQDRIAAAKRRAHAAAARHAAEEEARLRELGERYGYTTKRFALRVQRSAAFPHLAGTADDVPVTVVFSVKVPRTGPPTPRNTYVPPNDDVVIGGAVDEGITTNKARSTVYDWHALR
jgi:hypothetical protein